MSDTDGKNKVRDLLHKMVKPIAKRVIYNTVRPGPQTRWLYAGLFQLDYFSREVTEWARRSLIATPAFLSQCESYGEDIAIEILPYMTAPCRIVLGDKIRFGGKIHIISGGPNALLQMGNGVYVGHNTTFAVGERIEIHDFVGIGGSCHIADTEGHAQYAPDRPIWEVPPGDGDVAPVVLEKNVQVGNDVTILKGVRVGERAIIGAGSVVRSNIPADAVVMGNPARVVKRMTPPA